MTRSKKKNREDAARVRFAVLSTVVPEQDNFRFIPSRQLYQLRGCTGMQTEPVSDGNLPFNHVGFFGASSSLAI